MSNGTKPIVYVDGHAGTTGLRIREWLAHREDLDLVTLPDAGRKDREARRERIRSADVALLCLPDDAAREVTGWVADAPTRLIDASTAHRVADGWVYGLPELGGAQRDAIRAAKCVSNPGCYSSAFILLIRPLIEAGLIPADAPLTIHALSGYSGGGRPLIEKWEDPAGGLLDLVYEAPYALERVHKHVPEMMRYGGVRLEPQFVPAVGPFRCGMRVQVPLHACVLASSGAGGKRLWEALRTSYGADPCVRVVPYCEPPVIDDRSLDPQACNDTNRIDLHVLPHPSGHVLLVAILDNLGKGASGVAIQNLNLMLGRPETAGLPA
jgi:N-acetyl-gamma-glutamyl-phosphate reductase